MLAGGRMGKWMSGGSRAGKGGGRALLQSSFQ